MLMRSMTLPPREGSKPIRCVFNSPIKREREREERSEFTNILNSNVVPTFETTYSSIVKSALKHRVHKPWGFFPLKRGVLTKVHLMHFFRAFFFKHKAHFFELFVNFF